MTLLTVGKGSWKSLLGEYAMLFQPNSYAGEAHSVLGSEETIKTNHVLGVEYHQEWFGGGVGWRDRTRSFHGINCFYFHTWGNNWTGLVLLLEKPEKPGRVCITTLFRYQTAGSAVFWPLWEGKQVRWALWECLAFCLEALSGPQYRLKLSMVVSLNLGDRNENLERLRWLECACRKFSGFA